MITKYQMISMLAEDTAGQIARNGQEWMKYLDTARLYKYPFNEQMLIYAQRPDASACASLETWNGFLLWMPYLIHRFPYFVHILLIDVVGAVYSFYNLV